mmetsp:Transcript_59569/g.111480  ORF Transcript_59569/g.111480 Transcript_59569/m.111480 type:complete len:163 (-) Transcript_59569:24-512(-)
MKRGVSEVSTLASSRHGSKLDPFMARGLSDVPTDVPCSWSRETSKWDSDVDDMFCSQPQSQPEVKAADKLPGGVQQGLPKAQALEPHALEPFRKLTRSKAVVVPLVWEIALPPVLALILIMVLVIWPVVTTVSLPSQEVPHFHMQPSGWHAREARWLAHGSG